MLSMSGVYSTVTLNERANTEQYWRETIAKEVSNAKDLDEAKNIVLYGINGY